MPRIQPISISRTCPSSTTRSSSSCSTCRR
jgi:hypothetical protein